MAQSKKSTVVPSLTPEQEEAIGMINGLGSQYHEIALEYESYFIEKNAPTPFRITTAGHVNPGKSTLLNAILGSREVFKTGDARLTVVSQEENWDEERMLVDTPGCDSDTKSDDDEAYKSFRRADLILFVHNVNTGGIIKAELEILKDIRRMFGDAEFVNRVFLVCTRSDESLDAEDAKRNIEESLATIEKNLGCKLKNFLVSPRYWMDGMKMMAKSKKLFRLNKARTREEAEMLLEASAMQELIDEIRSASSMGKRQSPHIQALRDALQGKARNQQKEIDKTTSAYDKRIGGANGKWCTALQNVKSAWSDCR